MSAEKMQIIPYRGPLWDGKAVHPDLWELLLQTDRLIEIDSGPGPYQITLGVPHHAGPGVDRIAEDWTNPKTGRQGRFADETTGLTGLTFFSALAAKQIACKLVIAAHPTDHDPNKTPGSPYWRSVFEDSPTGLLFELHGAARHRDHALEISAGRNKLARPQAFGRLLAYFLPTQDLLAAQEKPGSSRAWVFRAGYPAAEGRLQNPALETNSLHQAGLQGIPALHLEMKSVFRQPDPNFPGEPQPQPAAWNLARAVVNVLEVLTRSDEVRINAADLGLPTGAFLTRPTPAYEASYLQAAAEASISEMNDNPDLQIDTSEGFHAFAAYAHSLILDGLPEHPPEEYLWLIDQGEFIGRVLLLQWLNAFRAKTDGQVDYWIRPSKRQQGYGKLILRLLIERCRRLGLDRLLISCRSDNLASKKIIEANGGIFESEIRLADAFGLEHPRLRYWIEIPRT